MAKLRVVFLRIQGSAKVSEEAGKKKAKQARRMTGKCWMAENFPISLTQLLPILEVVGNANKHIARVGKFLHKYGDMSLFPVKLQVNAHSPFANALSVSLMNHNDHQVPFTCTFSAP